MQITAFIRARMASSRFPGKVIANIGNRPAIQFMVERVMRSRYINNIVIITTNDKEDDKILDMVKPYGIFSYKSDRDVLQKFVDAAYCYYTDIIVDLTADCPFIDPNEIDEIIYKLLNEQLDYASNIEPRHLPIGFDIQVYRVDVLKHINCFMYDEKLRCHSGWNILNYDKTKGTNYRLGHLVSDVYHPDWRIVLDYPEDLELLNEIYHYFNNPNNVAERIFTQWDIIRLLELKLELLEINKHCRQKLPEEG